MLLVATRPRREPPASTPPELLRLFLILLENAVKYTPPGGAVWVNLSADSASYRVTITDTGGGISPDALPHIFERFFRGSRVRSGQNGVGLGLAIAQSLIRAMGGEITAASAADRGTVFVIRLQAADPPTASLRAVS